MQKRALVVSLAVLLAATAAVATRPSPLEGSVGRQLQQSARCPPGCAANMCVQDSTTAGLRCLQCQGSLQVRKSDGVCVCPKGTYSVNGTLTCADCPKGNYCVGGVFATGVPGGPAPTPCGPYLTTPGKRFFKSTDCINMPGYSYNVDANGIASATICPANTYGAGYKRQRQCVPCPTGFITDPADPLGKFSPTSCYIPQGYFLKNPGQAAPCPKGEWKSGIGASGNCTKCPYGVTTKAEASFSQDNCTDVVAGRYAVDLDPTSGSVLSTEICPQKYYCPGGDPAVAFNASSPTADGVTIFLCDNGLWTQEQGSTDVAQCLTPPGYKTSGTGAGATVACGSGQYRADWKPANQATQCLSCGDNVYADKTDILKVYDMLSPRAAPTNIMITTSADDCYIEPGQGLYYSTITGAWRARNCTTDNYGVANRTYGLTPAPCRDCPTNMKAVNDAVNYPNSTKYYVATTNVDGNAAGFVNALACVTQNGYGYNGRIAQQCDTGYYNARDNRAACTACSFGLTTSGVGLAFTEPDCGLAPGYGAVNVSGVLTTMPCPIGTYNDVFQANRNTLCTACPDGTTTTKEGASEAGHCNLCSPGRGGAFCAGTCGGSGANATYGAPGREVNSSCSSCSTAATGFSFSYNMTNDVFAPQAVSRSGANASTDCLLEFTQAADGAWYLPIGNYTGPGTTTTSVASIGACAALCTTDCMFVNYNYDTATCYTYVPTTAGIQTGDAWIGWKTSPAGDTSVSSFKVKGNNKNAKAKSVTSGQYSWFQEHQMTSTPAPVDTIYGTSAAPTNAASFTKIQECLSACDEEAGGICAGVFMYVASTGTPEADTAKSCKLIHGDTTPGVFTRTLVKTQLSNLALPTALKF